MMGKANAREKVKSKKIGHEAGKKMYRKGRITRHFKIRRRMRIVKRKGHEEFYDERKVYTGCYMACRNAHLSEQESAKRAAEICKDITSWMSEEKLVSSEQIFRKVIKELKQYSKDSAFMYETHRDIS